MSRLVTCASALWIGTAFGAVGCSSNEDAPPDGGPPAIDAPAGADAAVDAPPAPFAGVLSLNTNLSRTDPYSDYRVEYPATYAIGARGAQTAAEWKALEPTHTGDPCTTPVPDMTMITNPFFGLAQLEADGFTDVLLNLAIISMKDRVMPCDLAGLPFDDPAVIARYHAMLDRVLPYLGDNIKYISLGNEVDSYFKQPGNGDEWAAYKALIEDARTYLRTIRPGTIVGVTTTFEGASVTFPTEVASLNEHMDVVILNYYPLDFTTFQPRPPSTVAADMATMVSIAGTRPLVLQEWGYPAATSLGSSDAAQAEFITNTFAAWASHGAAKIPFLSLFKRRDWTQAFCDAMCPVSPAPPICVAFGAYLCSLGMLRNDGTTRPAYDELLVQIGVLRIGQ